MTAGHDVFISYARADAAKAGIIRDSLVALGLSVFLDTDGIDTGEEFPLIIDRAVKNARCVLGLWSRRAFEGRWVRIESRIGLDQRKLVAATIDGLRPAELPAEFYNVSVESLDDFDGHGQHAGWERVVRAIGKRVGRADLAALGGALERQGPPPRSRSLQRRGVLLLAGAGAAVAVALATLNPTALSPAPVAATTPGRPGADLSGGWSGVYTEAGRETRFELELRSTGNGEFAGSVREPDIYGIAGGQAFNAEIHGQVLAGGIVRFTKTYGEGGGPALRAVSYEGRISPDGRSVAGTWDTGTLHGPFYMDRR
ncbi:MAG: toll/interleukin-1 receptor domain-containing protein [Hyphomonadaceae bacterium]